MRMTRAAVLILAVCALGWFAAAAAASAPTPTYGAADVNGNPSEWDLTNDFYAPMYNAGNPADPVLANGYLRYDCSTSTLYVLVLQQGYGTESAVPLLSNPTGNAWAYIDGNKNTKQYNDSSTTTDGGTPPEFEWIGLNYDGTSTDAQGYEASFAIAPGDHTIVVHVEAQYNGASTAGFVGFNTNVTSDTVALDIPDSCTNTGGDTGGTPPPDQNQDFTLADTNPSDPVTPTYSRTFNWSIDKSLTTPSLVKQLGGTASVGYSVPVSETGFTDGDWQLTGKIDLSNPNSTALNGVTVTDSVDNGGDCSVANGSNLTLDPNSTVTLDYTCTWSSAPSQTSGTDTATATWDPLANNTPDGTASVQTPFSFGDPTTANNQNITVTDSLAGQLGTLAGVATTPYASTDYTYSRVFSVPAFGCQTHPNTATIVETSQTAGQSVTICGPANTGALSMGYWQNKNGQAQISGSGSTSGVCNVTQSLVQYAPFQDLSSTASCSAVASYVAKVVKSATASGASMNAMLKGQMLATALDVWYSKSNLAGFNMDLTKVPVGSGYESDVAAFGSPPLGAASVSTMLSYAASKSNVGGSSWYGNVKATQQLAKDAFDAIDNQTAFGA